MPPAPASKTARTDAIVEIERLGFKYVEVAQYDLTQLSDERRVQVRDANHYGPRDMVERFRIQMELNEFPPIVVTSDGYIVDGNTRVLAATKRKQNRFPAFVLDVAWTDARPEIRDKLHALGLTLNMRGSQPLEHAETRRGVRSLLRLGWTPQQIGRATGIKPSVIFGVQREEDAREKLERVEIKPDGELRGASLRALGSAPALALNDEPYKNLARLAADAGLNSTEIISAAKEIKATGSDTAGIAKIQEMRTEQAERIQTHELTGGGLPPLARQLRQRLGFIEKYRGQEMSLVETNAAVIPQHIDALEASVAVLSAVLEMQRGS